MMYRKLAGLAALAGLLACAWSAGAEEVPVLNPSFESFSGTASDNWDSGPVNVENVEVVWPLAPSDGERMLTLRGRTDQSENLSVQSYVRQKLEETIDESATYTLTFDMSRAGGGNELCPGGAELYWDNEGTPTRIVRASYMPGNACEYTTFQLQASGAELAGLGGKTLGIMLFSSPSWGITTCVSFDNVRLEKTPASVPQGSAVTVDVPDFSFEESGVNDRDWAGKPVFWGGSGWPISGSSYGQVPTEGSYKATNAAYQLMPFEAGTFIEGATYTLTVDASLRGDIVSGQPATDCSAIVLYREGQDIGDARSKFRGPTVGILDGTTMSIGNADGMGVAGDWTTLTLTYVATAADDGKRIGIGVLSPLPGRSAVFDNVRLTYQLGSGFPNPVSVAPGFTRTDFAADDAENSENAEQVAQPLEATFDLNVRSKTTYDVPRDEVLSLGDVTCTEGSTVNVSGTLQYQSWEVRDGSTWSMGPGSSQFRERGAARIGHKGGRAVYWNIMGGSYVDLSTEFTIGEGGGVAIINQASGLVKLNADLEFCNTAEDPCMWYLSGGQLVVAGSGHRPENYVEMVRQGSRGGIELSSRGELYIRGDRTKDLRLLDSDGDALLTGARFAEFGDWTLLDGTEISGYTRFRATASPTDTRTGENSDP